MLLNIACIYDELTATFVTVITVTAKTVNATPVRPDHRLA